MLLNQLKQNEGLQRLLKDGRGSAIITIKGGIEALSRKTTLLSSTVTSGGEALTATGVLPIERHQTVMPGARRQLFIRDLLTATPLTEGVADFVRVETDVLEASPQADAAAKHENAVTLRSYSATAKTISTFLPASRNIMRDLDGLAGFVEGSLTFAVRRKEQEQVFLGDNTGHNLNGLVRQATAFNTALLSATAGWKYMDILGRAAQQIEEAEETEATFCALHPTRYWAIRLQKNAAGDYIHGPVTEGEDFRIFGMVPIRTKTLALDQFLVGSSAPSEVELRDRMELTVEISTQHSDYFSKGLLAIRAEERVALVCYKPGSFVSGSFSQSPA